MLAGELKRPGVNLVVLWEEYRAGDPNGYGYSRFCDLFREFGQRLSPVMRQTHVAGDKVFVDYSGKKLAIADPTTGEIREAEIFVAVLGASGYTYAEATWTQTLPDWIGSHVRMFEFFQGCPRLVVPDNLKSGVNKPSFFDPEINRSYAMMAAHDGVHSDCDDGAAAARHQWPFRAATAPLRARPISSGANHGAAAGDTATRAWHRHFQARGGPSADRHP